MPRPNRDASATREDPQVAIRRDIQRLAQREKGTASFWRSLSVMGMVGWPIAMGAVGGALLGRWIDQRFDRGLSFTLMFLSAGVAVGCFIAWKSVTQKHD